MATYTIQRVRRHTAADWTANNPKLEDGQIGYETDTRKSKVGDAAGTLWNSLSYTVSGGGGGGGGLSDGDYGDITVSGSGTAMAIDNDAVTYAKMQNVSATDKLLGRATSGAGNVEEIDCTAAGRALLDDANAAAQRTTLGLGSISTQAASSVSITGGAITGMPSPSSSSDVATKAYVDGLANGLAWKAPVVVATTGAGTLATSFANGQTVDGVTLATGDRILIKDQASGAENGIYVVAASGAPARAADADTAAELRAAAVTVERGTANADRSFVCTTDSVTLGTTALVWVNHVSADGGLVAANNLSDVSSASTARANLGLAIGTNVQAFNANLAALAGLSGAANKISYFTGSGAMSLADLPAAMITFLGTPNSSNFAALVTDETGSGGLVFANSPTLVTPVLGVASATSINKVAITAPATGSTLTIADGKTLTCSNTVTFTANDGSTLAIGAGGTLASMAYQAAGSVAITGGSITGMSSPSSASDVATKAYVDSFQQGQTWKNSVRAATTSAGTLATGFENGDVIDGVTLATGDRILIKDQASGAENGIYIVAASGAPTRATDADASAELLGASVMVREGTANADKAFVCTNDTITVGSTALVWTQTAGGGGVSSVGLSLPAEFSVSGSPVTSTGTLTAGWANQNANLILASPASGSAAPPSMRAMVPADLPATFVAGLNPCVGDVLRSPLAPGGSNLTLASGTAYWVYLGYFRAGTVFKYIRCAVITAGAGAQTAEVCIATSATPPTGSSITLTKVWADGTLGSLTSNNARVGNSSANTTALSADAHVWAGIRTAMATTQPTLRSLTWDWGDGFWATTAAAGVLTSGSSWTASPSGFSNNGADLRAYLS